MSIDINLIELKMYIRPKTWQLMSEFFIAGLKRMDEAKRKFSSHTADEKRKMEIKSGT